jgi:hypothetical protein
MADLSSYINITANNINSLNAVSTTGNTIAGNLTTTGFVSATGNVRGGNINTVGLITATGNITGNYILGNGSLLTGIAASYGNANVTTFLGVYGSNNISTSGNITAGNLIGNYVVTNSVTGTLSNVTLIASTKTWTFDYNGNLTVPTAGNILLSNSISTISSAGNIAGNYIFGNGSQLTGLPATYGNANVATYLAAFGSNNISTTGNITGNGSQLTGVATKTTGSWSLVAGTNTVSITVPADGTYSMWVNGNIPNGICVWNATVTVTNTNVPVIGSQYAWYYADGNALVLTSIPAQIIGTNGVIDNATGSGTTNNVFTFNITNNSGLTQTVYWGYVTLD